MIAASKRMLIDGRAAPQRCMNARGVVGKDAGGALWNGQRPAVCRTAIQIGGARVCMCWSLILPLRRAFFDESPDSLFGIAGKHVLDHDV